MLHVYVYEWVCTWHHTSVEVREQPSGIQFSHLGSRDLAQVIHYLGHRCFYCLSHLASYLLPPPWYLQNEDSGEGLLLYQELTL